MDMVRNIRIASERHAKWVRSAKNEKEVARLWLNGKLILAQSERFGGWPGPLVALYLLKLKEFGRCPIFETIEGMDGFDYFMYEFLRESEFVKSFCYDLW